MLRIPSGIQQKPLQSVFVFWQRTKEQQTGIIPQVKIDKAISIAKSANMKQVPFQSQELEGDELRAFLGQANEGEGNDNWWVYALGLLLLGIGALLFYYV